MSAITILLVAIEIFFIIFYLAAQEIAFFLVVRYSCSTRKRSASRAALHPIPADVMACR